MERKSIIPRRRVSAPRKLEISSPAPPDVTLSGPRSSPLPPPKEQDTHQRSKTLSLQLGSGGEKLSEFGTGKYNSPASSKYWTGRSGLQSPRLHGFSPREVNAFKQRKSTVESILEEGNREGGGNKEARGEGERLVFEMSEKGLGIAVSSREEWGASGGPPTKAPRDAARQLHHLDWPLPLLPGVGVLPDTIYPSPTMASHESDTNQSYRFLNRSSVSATGRTTLQNVLGSSSLKQHLPSIILKKELPPLSASPVYPCRRVSPLLPPPNLEEGSRLVSITPSLIAELELEELEGKTFSGENTKTAEVKPRKVSGKRAANVPILSSFLTDTSTDLTEDEPEDETGQADCLPIQTVPGPQLNLVEIDSGDPAVGRKRSVKRKPVLGKSKLIQEWRNKSRNNSGPDSPRSSSPVRAQDLPWMLDTKRTNHRRQAHPPLDQKSHGIQPMIALSPTSFYEGYALRFKSGVYVPLNLTTSPLDLDQNLYMVVPKKDINDGAGGAYHIILPYLANQSIDRPGEGLYVYDETSRGFIPAQAAIPLCEGRNHDQNSISSLKDFLSSDAGKAKEKGKNPQPQAQQKEFRNILQRLSGYASFSKTGGTDERNYNDQLIDTTSSQPTIRRKQAKLLGLGGGTREIGNIEHMKCLGRGNSVKIEAEKQCSRRVASGDWAYSGNVEDVFGDGNGNKSEGGERYAESGIYVTKEFEVDLMHSPTEALAKEEEVGSETDVEAGKRRRKMSLNGQSWLEVAENPTTTPAVNNPGGWREATTIGIMKEEEAVSPIENMEIPGMATALKDTPRLPMYNPPNDMANIHMHSPLLSPLINPPLSSGLNTITDISQPGTAEPQHSAPQLLQQSHPKPRRKYITLTLNLYRNHSEPFPTSRILIPVSSVVRGLDDREIFGRVRKEYIALSGGEWRTWLGLRGIMWVGINEHLKSARRLRSLSANNSHSQRSGGSAGDTHLPLDPTLTRSARLVQYVNKPQTARGQRRYMDLLRGSVAGVRSVTYSIEIVEDWMLWKVVIVGAAPMLASVAATATWYYIGYGRGLMAFQIGILIAILGWGVVGVLVLLS